MESRNWKAAVALSGAALVLNACGGGGDPDAGSPTAFSVVPDTVTVSALSATNGGPAAGLCMAGEAGTVFVYGGVAPYRLDNTVPDIVQLDKSEVSDRGGSFKVTYKDLGGGLAACMTDVIVVVVDKLDNQVTLKLNNKPSS